MNFSRAVRRVRHLCAGFLAVAGAALLVVLCAKGGSLESAALAVFLMAAGVTVGTALSHLIMTAGAYRDSQVKK